MSQQASDPALREVLERLTVVVVDPSSTSRANVRKALTDLGVGFDNVHMVDNYRVATKALALKRPDIVLLEYDGEWGEALPLLREFRAKVEHAADTAVFFTAPGNADYAKSVAAREDVAGVFFKPYTYAYLSRQLADAVRGGGELDLYQRILRDARTLLWKGDVEAARRQFARARAVARTEVHAHAYLGELELSEGGGARSPRQRSSPRRSGSTRAATAASWETSARSRRSGSTRRRTSSTRSRCATTP